MAARHSFVAALFVVLASGVLSCSKDTPPQPSCTYSVASPTVTFTSAGGQGSATVGTGASCSWTAATDSPWVTFPGGASGSGQASVAFTVASNSATDLRKATLTIAGLPIAISQEGRAPCDYAVSPSSLDVAAAGGAASVTIATAAGCEWTASSSAPWVTLTSAASGTGSGTVGLMVSTNAATDSRQANLSVAGRPVTLRQDGTTPSPPKPTSCDYSVSPIDTTVHWHVTGFSVSISTAPGCTWTVASPDGWLAVDRASGSGPASIAVSFSQFTEDATRRAAVQIRWPTPTAGQNAWVTQEGCRYGFESAASFPAAGGTRTVMVVTQPVSSSCAIGCPWTATSNASWIRVTSSMPRAGDDVFAYQVDANTGTPRVGTITVAGRTHTVSQSGI
jgi:hypothetical protein